MTDAIPGKNVSVFLADRQAEATQLQAVLQGIDILLESERGRNAALALIAIALKQTAKLTDDLDSVNWPKAMA